jgi:DHA1 family bicyclomycin/chloramphenicol resistance-like MFS transporter
MTNILLPSVWLIVMLVGLPQLSETVYTPSLPEIAKSLQTSESMVEYTITIYLCGFAIGTLFWGKVSDKLGRKPCIIAGLLVFSLGCIGCYVSQSIEILMISRLIQAFGGSIGSVLGQSVCRDVFHGSALGKVYSAAGSALAIFPALGPLCGGVIAEIFGWRDVFIFLIFFTAVVTFLVIIMLPETHPKNSRQYISILDIAMQLIVDRKVIGYASIVGGCNGIFFSYFAEGSFYLINQLGLSASNYGLSFIVIGSAAMLGGIVSKKLCNKFHPQQLISYGLLIITAATAMFSLIVLINHSLLILSAKLMIIFTILSQSICVFGTSMACSNALALALVDYKHAVGTASSLFGFFYYILISICTLFMGLLHNGTLLPMPLYFFSIAIFMVAVNRICFYNSKTYP